MDDGPSERPIRYEKLRRWVAIVALACIAMLLVLLLLVSFVSLIPVVVSIALTIFGLWFSESGSSELGGYRLTTHARIVVSIVLWLLSILLSLKLTAQPSPPRTVYPPKTTFSLVAYRSTIHQMQDNSNAFSITEYMELKPSRDYISSSHRTISRGSVVTASESRKITSSWKGLLLREVSYFPAPSDKQRHAIPHSTYGLLYGDIDCPFSCEGQITIYDMPNGSFYQSRDASPTITPYADTETITWTDENLDRAVVFSYIPPPLNTFSGVLRLFPFENLIGASRCGQVFLVVFSTVLVLLAKWVCPSLPSSFAHRVRAWLWPRQPEQKPAPAGSVDRLEDDETEQLE